MAIKEEADRLYNEVLRDLKTGKTTVTVPFSICDEIKKLGLKSHAPCLLRDMVEVIPAVREVASEREKGDNEST